MDSHYMDSLRETSSCNWKNILILCLYYFEHETISWRFFICEIMSVIYKEDAWTGALGEFFVREKYVINVWNYDLLYQKSLWN